MLVILFYIIGNVGGSMIGGYLFNMAIKKLSYKLVKTRGTFPSIKNLEALMCSTVSSKDKYNLVIYYGLVGGKIVQSFY